MKSSGGALFTRQNPFVQDPPLGKAHYNPTRTQKLPKQQRKTTLSPVRLTKPSGSPPVQTLSLSPEDQRFLSGANHLVLCPPPATDTQPSFSESWPSTDLGSSPANTTPSPNADAVTQAKQAGKSMDPDGRGDQEDSVLAKYVERFRHGRPQSREERQQMGTGTSEGQEPFWWLSPSPLPSSSTPTQTSDKKFSFRLKNDPTGSTLSPVGNPQHDSTLSNCTNLLDLSAMGLSDSSHGYLGDSDILQLQERANRLLHRSEHSVSSGSVPISSEGLACSDFSSPVSVDEPVRRPTIPSLIDSTTVNPRTASFHANPVLKPLGRSANRTRPEEDILFQWRLRRKMENARLWPQSLSQQPQSAIWQDHKIVFPADRMRRGTPNFTPAPQDTESAPHGPCGPEPAPSLVPSFPISSPTVSKLLSDAPVPAHMHLLCDVLPCPDRPSPQPVHRKSPQRWQVSGSNIAPRQPSGPANSADTSTEEPASKHESSPPPASSETTGEEWVDEQRRAEGQKTKEAPPRKHVEQSEKQPGTSSRKKKKKTARVRGDHAERPVYTDKSLAAVHQRRSPDRAHTWREDNSRDPGRQERAQGLTREGRPGDCAPPPSPIHSALGQVISGVLFPTPDSPPGPRTPMSVDTPPAPPQSPAALASVQPPTEVISQLLQEAEDSDEKEFEDDPLLQVLRKQRRWVKEQLRQVDSLLEDLQEE
ncbi:proline and serine-rich protein 3 isoform X1 [Osmerus eperlanus]|uniref:proline and serine-rich protein 3 isoform X1 n=1 Tax=Osmerus eperlanus TaxID=29151 RepID=UPI002E0F89B2